MGSFYGSVHVRSGDLAAVQSVVADLARESGNRFWVAPPVRGWVTVYPSGHGQDEATSAAIAARTGTVVLHLLAHDGDILCYTLRRGSELLDRFHSHPGCFGEVVTRDDREALAGQPELYADLLVAPATPASVRSILERVGQTGAEEAMAQLARSFGLGKVVSAYEYLERGDSETVTGFRKFCHVPDRAPERRATREVRSRERALTQQLVADRVLRLDVPARRPRVGEHPMTLVACAGGSGFLVLETSPFSQTVQPLRQYGPPWRESTESGIELRPSVHKLVASGDARHLAAIHATDTWETEVFDWTGRRRLFTWQHSSHSTSLAVFHPDGERILVERDGRATMLARDARECLSFPLPPQGQHVAIHPDGAWAVVGGIDSSAATLTLVDLGSGAVRSPLVVGRPLEAVLGAALEATKLAMVKRVTDLAKEQQGDWGKVLERAHQTVGPPHDREALERGLGEMLTDVRVESARLTAVALRDCYRLSDLGFDSRGRWLLAASDHGLLAFPWDELLAARDEAPTPRRLGPELRPLLDPAAWLAASGAPLVTRLAHHAIHDRVRDRVLFTVTDGTIHSADLATGEDLVLVARVAEDPGTHLAAFFSIALSGDGATLLSIDWAVPLGGGLGLARLRIWDLAALTARAARGRG